MLIAGSSRAGKQPKKASNALGHDGSDWFGLLAEQRLNSTHVRFRSWTGSTSRSRVMSWTGSTNYQSLLFSQSHNQAVTLAISSPHSAHTRARRRATLFLQTMLTLCATQSFRLRAFVFIFARAAPLGRHGDGPRTEAGPSQTKSHLQIIKDAI